MTKLGLLRTEHKLEQSDNLIHDSLHTHGADRTRDIVSVTK